MDKLSAPTYAQMHTDGVEVIYLDQPEKKNAISAEMMVLLHGLLLEADTNDDVKVVVLRGAGDNFSSGGDLSQSSPEEASPENARKNLKHYLRAIKALRSIAKPVIAMVDGYAVGGAFSLVLACDLVCASTRAVFVPAFCQIGIIPEMGMMQLLPGLVGAQRAKEMLFFGGKYSAEKMQEMGLINKLCPAEELQSATLGWASELAMMPDASIQITKSIMNSFADKDLDALLESELTASPLCTTTKAYKKAMKRYER